MIFSFLVETGSHMGLPLLLKDPCNVFIPSHDDKTGEWNVSLHSFAFSCILSGKSLDNFAQTSDIVIEI